MEYLKTTIPTYLLFHPQPKKYATGEFVLKKLKSVNKTRFINDRSLFSCNLFHFKIESKAQ